MNRIQPASRGARQTGFTLLELLVALTLMSLLVVMLFAGLRFGARVWDGEAAHSERIADVRLAQEFLRRQLEQAWQTTLGDIDGDAPARFEGSRERVRFIAPWPSRASSAQLYLHELYLSGEGSRADLVLALSPYRPREDRSADFRVTPLLRDVKDAAFGYYGPNDDDDPSIWRTEWQDRQDLPALVRVRIGFAAGAGRAWPDLVVALRRNAEF